MNYAQTSESCLKLAIEGERLCRAGELRNGISCFHSALSNGTDDLRCLSAIYCQLGNAYFCRQNYTEALEYHRWDFTLARLTNDAVSENQASGNLGNTLKMLGKYDEAILCFNRQLDIARQLSNQHMEARALYNLGNVYHAKGKQWARTSGQSDPGELPTEAIEAQHKAVEYYRQNLALVRQLGDRPAEGRVLGNLGNTHYLLGDFHEAIECHRERLNFANEFGDLAAQRRAYSNLGNAFIFLADFNSAAINYRNALRLAQQLKDIALEAQACYSLGNTYTLLRDPTKAVVFHLRHLVIARRLGDRVGEGRAHWSLANAYTALGRYDSALRCARRHRMIARQLQDDTGLITAQLMIREITCLKAAHDTQQRNADPQSGNETNVEHCAGTVCSPKLNGVALLARAGYESDLAASVIATTNSMTGMIVNGSTDETANEDPYGDEDTELDADLERELAATATDILDTVEVVTLGEDGRTTAIRFGCLDFSDNIGSSSNACRRENMANFYFDAPVFRHHSTQPIEPTDGTDIEEQLESIGTANQLNDRPPVQSTNSELPSVPETSSAVVTEEEQAEDPQECFFSLLLTSQSRRMDEQRCCLRTTTPPSSSSGSSGTSTAITGAQANASMYTNLNERSARTVVTTSGRPHLDPVSDEALFDLIEGVQGDRMDDQRASLPAFPGLRAGPGLQLFENSRSSLGNLQHNLMRASSGSGASDGLPEPWHDHSPLTVPALQRAASVALASSSNGTPRELDDEFLEMILRLQTATRIDDQRSNLPDPLCRIREDAHLPVPVSQTNTDHENGTGPQPGETGAQHNRPTAPTVPDEDFFALIHRVQSTRLDEQRCNPPSGSSVLPVTESQLQTAATTTGSSTCAPASSGKLPANNSRRRVGSWRRSSTNQNK
ncbi:G-protein-signaling modulator 2 [Paragonimus heterotremus]|uniref:G-protein-signaling modulator 2 n=1 Tax=Paragonimus heterotremus TaxID=100268 RepID=A0A8J4T814_9TREM|nr:G-protein-signaling modulator 2 [Paragonimus heterotremus]